MRAKWVDTSDYIGPDRRKRPGPKRWKERRQSDDAGNPPPLGALLRRLRVSMLGLNDPKERHRARQFIAASISEAERQQLFQCADALKHAARALDAGDLFSVETRIVDAHSFAVIGGQY